MAGRYQVYPEYKDSECAWIGQIPVHWKTAALSKLFCIKAGGDLKAAYFSETKTGEHPYPIYTNTNSENAVYGYTSECSYDPNTITVSGRGDVGFAVSRDHAYDAIIRLLVLAPDGDSYCKFFVYFINEVIDFRVESSAIGQLSTQQISPYKVAFPTIGEQTQIANFLDQETAKIDTLIEKQQLLITLLKEKRQAVISHAVTKGLNPEAPMRDSGVEWLGKVPEHWVCCTLKHCGRVIDCKHITAEFFDEGVPLASISEVKEWFVNLETAKLTSEKYYFDLIDAGRKPQSGDIIYSRNATVGEAALVDENMPLFAMGQDVCLIRLNEAVLSEYALYVLKSGVISQQLDLAMVGSTFKRINVDNIRNFSIALPPYKEQVEIANELSCVLGKYDLLILKAQTTIELLQERRTALISAAVTGKIDVRNWQAPVDSCLRGNHKAKEGAA